MFRYDFKDPTLLNNSEWTFIHSAMNMGWLDDRNGRFIWQIDHPVYGMLTATRTGDEWMVFRGEYVNATDDTRPSRFSPYGRLVDEADVSLDEPYYL